MTNGPDYTTYVIDSREREGAHWLDLFDVDLDEIFAGTPFLDGRSIDWGTLYEINPDPPYPEEVFTVAGVDWHAIFAPPDTQADPRLGNNRDVPFHCCIIVAHVRVQGSLNEARDRGRPAVRHAVAIIQSLVRTLAGQSPVWEGPVSAGGAPGTVQFADVRRTIRVSSEAIDSFRKRFDVVANTTVTNTDESLALSAYWYAKAWDSTDLIERFIGFWLAALSHIDSKGTGKRQRTRISSYAKSLIPRAVMSAGRADTLRAGLSRAYDLRIELFHDGAWSIITADEVAAMERLATEIFTIESRLAS